MQLKLNMKLQKKNVNENYQKKKMTKEEIIDILINDAEYTQDEINDMSNFKLFNAWCIWEGILGYSLDIWETVIELYDDDVTIALND